MPHAKACMVWESIREAVKMYQCISYITAVFCTVEVRANRRHCLPSLSSRCMLHAMAYMEIGHQIHTSRKRLTWLAVQVYKRLQEIDAYGAEARAATILAGLSFDNSMQVLTLHSSHFWAGAAKHMSLDSQCLSVTCLVDQSVV